MIIITIMDIIFQVYWWMLMARFLVTWLPNVNYGHPLIVFLSRVTDPVVRPFEGIVPPYGNVDFSPLILFLVLRLVYPLVRMLLIQLVALF